MRLLRAFLCLAVCTGAALAEPPDKSLRPVPRPAQAKALVETLVAAAPATAPAAMPGTRPQRRPDGQTVAAPEKPRKGLLTLLAPRAKPARKAVPSRQGSVCGDPSIKGKVLPRITSKTKGCGIADPVSITSIDGLRLSEASTMDCPTAIALNSWVQKGLRPAFGGSEIIELKVAGHYVCRSRNNVRGAKISEHGRGKAIDIAGFVLANGEHISVHGDFNKTMRKAHKAACGIFRTTLGPGSDGYHEDHLHFDTASRKGSAYCR